MGAPRIILALIVLVGSTAMLFANFGLLAILVLSVFAGIEGWILFSYFHYRNVRQNDMLELLASAAENQQPLGPAVKAYLLDRPRGPFRSLVQGFLQFFVYLSIARRYRFDRQAEMLSILLNSGQPLPLALEAVPGVVPRDTPLAAAVGQATGRLAYCLRSLASWRLTNSLLLLVPRFVYPLIVLISALGVNTFLVVYIIPKFEKLFADFKVPLPPSTWLLITVTRDLDDYALLMLAGFVVFVGLGVLCIFHSGVRWHFPILGRYYRRLCQGQVLKFLGVLLGAGMSVPHALTLMSAPRYTSGTVRRRLLRVRQGVAQGRELPTLLREQGLLPGAMVPLLDLAVKGNNMPWLLDELSEHLVGRTIRGVQRLSNIFLPIAITLIALAVGLISLGMFTPLITLMDHVGK